MAHRGRFPSDDALALALARGLTIRDAAKTARVSERTAHRRNGNQIFRALVTELRAEMIGNASGRLASAMAAAAETLATLLEHPNPAVRLKAAREILERGVKLREATELEQRIADLEAQQNHEEE